MRSILRLNQWSCINETTCVKECVRKKPVDGNTVTCKMGDTKDENCETFNASNVPVPVLDAATLVAYISPRTNGAMNATTNRPFTILEFSSKRLPYSLPLTLMRVIKR